MFQDQDNLGENQRTDQHGGDTAEADLVAFKDENLEPHENSQPSGEKQRHQDDGLQLAFQFFPDAHRAAGIISLSK